MDDSVQAVINLISKQIMDALFHAEADWERSGRSQDQADYERNAFKDRAAKLRKLRDDYETLMSRSTAMPI